MNLRARQILKFNTKNPREETILKANNNLETGMIKTDAREYSAMFISLWIEKGWIRVIKKKYNTRKQLLKK